MVGVAGKSKGCNTCRQRKCDEAIVPCGPCLKSKKTCAGYSRNRHFKNLSPLDHNSILARAQPLVPHTKPSILRLENSPLSSLGGAAGGQRKPAYPIASNDGVFEMFMSEYMPSKADIGLKDGETPLSWMQVIPLMKRENPSLGNALSALSMVRMGRKLDDKKLQRRGQALYGLALEAMQKSLQEEASHDQTLASCLTMAIFELLELPGDDIHGWTSHILGLSKLFQLRGPQQCASGPSHYLFLGFRATEIIHALATRQPSYLGEQTWLSTPWKIIPKSAFHRLLDIMTQLPAALARVEAFHQGNLRKNTQEGLLNESLDLERKLNNWYMNFQASSTRPLFSRQHFPFSRWTDVSGKAMQEGIQFVDFECARMHLFYWAALLLIYANIWTFPCGMSGSSMQGRDQRARHDCDLTSAHDLESKILETGLLILESIPYLLSDDAHILGPQNVFFPLRIAQYAFSVLHNRNQEEKYCKDIFKQLRRRGYPFGELLSETRWNDIPALLSGNHNVLQQ